MEAIPFNIITFPFWWYTTGLLLTWQWAKGNFNWTLKKSGLRLFFRHFGDTLYGYNSWQDRIISFFLRIFLGIFKVFDIFFKIILLILALAVYLSALPLVIALVVYYIF